MKKWQSKKEPYQGQFANYLNLPVEKIAKPAEPNNSQDELFVIERETRSFVKLYNFIPESECLLITNSEEAMLDCEGISIEVVPVWKWLLQFSMNNKNEDYV